MTAKHPNRRNRHGVDTAGRTPLHYAAADGNLDEVRRLIESGIDPNEVDDDGWTPLHFATQAWAVDVASLLLDSAAQVNARDSHGNTPLFRAVFNSQGRGELIQILRERGADAGIVNDHGVSPLSLSRTIANYDVRRYFDDLPAGENGDPEAS